MASKENEDQEYISDLVMQITELKKIIENNNTKNNTEISIIISTSVYMIELTLAEAYRKSKKQNDMLDLVKDHMYLLTILKDKLQSEEIGSKERRSIVEAIGDLSNRILSSLSKYTNTADEECDKRLLDKLTKQGQIILKIQTLIEQKRWSKTWYKVNSLHLKELASTLSDFLNRTLILIGSLRLKTSTCEDAEIDNEKEIIKQIIAFKHVSNSLKELCKERVFVSRHKKHVDSLLEIYKIITFKPSNPIVP